MLRRAIRKETDRVPGPELCIVERYDYLKQRVDVRLKNREHITTLSNVPIAGVRRGRLMHYMAIRSITQNSATEATVGWLVPFRSDSRYSFADRGFTAPSTKIVWNGESWYFVPDDTIMLNEIVDEPAIKVASSPTSDQIGPNDDVLYHEPSGSYIAFKPDGKLIIKADEILLVDKDGTVASAKKLARKDDPVSVSLITGIGTITDGSSIVKGS